MHHVPIELASDLPATARRSAALDSYYTAQILDAERHFICQSAAACESSALRKDGVGFHPAQGAAVGANYDLLVGDLPLRVLIIAMETGQQRSRVTIEERTSEVEGLINVPFKKWNPHMRGVAFALRLAFRARRGR